jgi:hypothetical protein
MPENLDHILIFKTNIKTEEDKLRVSELLCTHEAIEDWHVDSEDVDCVLRVVSYSLLPQQVNSLINNAGFNCLELE